MTPPFRADHVGGLLRPPYIRDDPKRAIREVAAKQEAIGLESVTDGEFSRQWWNPGPKFGGTEEQPPIPTVMPSCTVVTISSIVTRLSGTGTRCSS